MSGETATGRAKGGVATAAAMTPEELKARGSKGAAARWSDDIKQATHGSADHPLKIGDIEIPCYVLEDETRVLSQRGVQGALGIKRGTRRAAGGGDQLIGFLSTSHLLGFVSSDLMAVMENPIKFRNPGGGGFAFGYPATFLADICDAVLAARKADALPDRYKSVADQCEILVRGFARVGIIALVDEATGFQRDRTKDALARILQAFIDKELQPWVQTFPAEFYQEMFRLRGLDYRSDTVKRPQYFGMLTNNIVYKRIAPGVLDELKRVIPRDGTGRHKAKFFQMLTKSTGYPKLKEHLGAVVAFMQTSENWSDFMTKMDKFKPKQGTTIELDLAYPSEDDGKGL